MILWSIFYYFIWFPLSWKGDYLVVFLHQFSVSGCIYFYPNVASMTGILCRYWDVNYYRRRQMSTDDGMNFIESVIKKGLTYCSFILCLIGTCGGNETYINAATFCRFFRLSLVMGIQIKDWKKRGGRWYCSFMICWLIYIFKFTNIFCFFF